MKPLRVLVSLLWASALGVSASCTAETDPQAGTLFRGGKVLTANPERLTADLLAIRGDRIAFIGDSAVSGHLGWEHVVDLRGAVMAPAFVDHHIHLLNVGFALLNARENQRLFLDLSEATSLEHVAERIRGRVDASASGTWILGTGWSQAAWGTDTLPTHDILTHAAPHNPVYLVRIDGHAGWVNRAALQAAGIDGSTPDPPGGAILRRRGGEPSGVLLERANELVIPFIPGPSDEQVERAFRLAAEAMAARGVHEVYDAGFLAYPGVVALNIDFERYVTLLERVDAAHPLPIAVNLMVPAPSAFADSLTAHPDQYPARSPRVRVTHLKLFADGALGSRGAALTHPYADDPSTSGVYRMTQDAILREARRAVDAGLGVATHAIGDGAVHRTLDVYAQLLHDRPDLDSRRLRIEHFSYVQEADFERAVRLGVVLSIQSNFNSPADERPSFGDKRVGRENSRRVYAWDRLERMGAWLAEGSDYYTAPGPALLGFHAALTRHNAVGTRGGGPAGRLVAFRLHTTLDPSNGGPPTQGWLAPGGPADLVILSANPLSVEEPKVLQITILATFRAGRVTYDGGQLPSIPSLSARLVSPAVHASHAP